jgi:hypothetical protein
MRSKKLTNDDLMEISGAMTSEERSKEDFADELPDVDIDALARELKHKEPKKRGRKKKENYVDPELFRKQIAKFYKDDVMTEDLGKAVQDIATRLGFMPNFLNYTYKDEMIGDAVEKMMKALWNKKYDIERGSPFSYYTKIAFNAFCNRIKKEKRNHEAILNYQSDVYETLICSGNLPDDHMEHTGDHTNDD